MRQNFHPLGYNWAPLRFRAFRVPATQDERESQHGPPKHWHTCGYKSLHRGGANFLMGDGGVHFFAEFIDYRLYNELGTRAGQEVVKVP